MESERRRKGRWRVRGGGREGVKLEEEEGKVESERRRKGRWRVRGGGREGGE